MNEAPVYPKGVTSYLIRYFIPSKQLDIKIIASQNVTCHYECKTQSYANYTIIPYTELFLSYSFSIQ